MTEITEYTVVDIVDIIAAGSVDDYLDEIVGVIDERKRRLASDLFYELKIKDRVRVKAPLRPRYLEGALGTVVDKRVTKITVQFDDDIHDPYGKWAGKRAVLSPSQVEKVSS